jgi:hypothetical protein
MTRRCPVPDVPALFSFSILLRREDAHPSRRFLYEHRKRVQTSGMGSNLRLFHLYAL